MNAHTELGTGVVVVTGARNAATSFLTISLSVLSAMLWLAGDVDLTGFEMVVYVDTSSKH
jgi:hypothetical protein